MGQIGVDGDDKIVRQLTDNVNVGLFLSHFKLALEIEV